jgi:hypothetical protein
VPAAVSPGVLREQVTTFTTNVLDELHRARPGYFDPDDVAQILGPLVDRYDYSLGLGPLIDQIERAANGQRNEIAVELMDFAQYLREEQHVPPGPAVAPATQISPTEVLTFLDFMREDIARDRGQDVADRAWTIANRVLIDQLPNGIPALVAELRDRATRNLSGEVSDALDAIAHGIEQGDHQVAALGAFEPEAPHPAGPGGVQDIAHHLLEIERRPDGTLSTEGLASTAYALLHGQLDYPGYTQIPPGPERAQAMQPLILAFSGVVEDALGFPITDLEVAPPAPAPAPVAQFSPVPRHIQNETTDVLLRALDDPAAVNNVIDIATRYIQGNTPEDLAVLPQLIRTTNVGLHQTMGMVSRELLARQIEDRHPQQAQEQNLLRTPYNELQQVITPIERTLVTSMQTRIAQQAVAYGIDGSEVADMIRRRSPSYGEAEYDLSTLSPQALEVLARDTSDAIEARNRARGGRGQQ